MYFAFENTFSSDTLDFLHILATTILLICNFFFDCLLCRPLTIPSITLPPSATEAFSASKFTKKFEGDDKVDSQPKNELIEEEEKYLEAFKVCENFNFQCIIM